MNEADTRAELIDPALKEAGWGVVEGSRVRREVITLGRLQARFAYATNGVGIYRVDMHTGEEGLVSGYPTPPAPCPVCGEVPCQCGGGGEQRVVEIELAPGKYRQLQHMSATTFWSPEGKPISAADFIGQLYGDLPALFQDEETLRELWSRPDTSA